MRCDFHKTIPDIVQIWLNNVRSAPFTAGNKGNMIPFPEIRRDIQAEAESLFQREGLWAIHQQPQRSYIDQVSDGLLDACIQNQNVI